ncbi:hypothetical protein [Actinomadura sp. SCN-SB]
MRNRKQAGLLAVVLVLVVVMLEVFAVRLGSLELHMPNEPAIAENP